MKLRSFTITLFLVIFIFFSISHGNEFDVSKFTAMRMDYANSSSYDPLWDKSDKRKKIIALFKDGKYEEGLKIAQDWLNKYPFNAELHLFGEEYFLLRSLGAKVIQQSLIESEEGIF